MAGSIITVADLLGITGPTWSFWRMVLAVLFDLPLTTDQRDLALKHTGRTTLFSQPIRQLWLCCGRRAGKSRILALIAVFLACFCDYSDVLAPGEVGVVLLVAPSQRQARVLLNYILGFMRSVPMLARLIVSDTEFSVTLTNGIVIEVGSNDWRRVRGSTVVAAEVDECAFLPQADSAIPDTELLNAIRPAMGTVRNSLLICSSTPHAPSGELHKASRTHFGNDDSAVMFVNADTLTANPTMDEAIIAQAFEEDAQVAGSEYGSGGFVQFRSDVQRLCTAEALDLCTDWDRPLVLPPCFEGPRLYHGFVDPSGGSSDSMTMAVAHRDPSGRFILDGYRERKPPFSPDDVVREFAEILNAYRVAKVAGDRYSGEWVRESFRSHGIAYQHSELTRSEIYIAFVALLNSARVKLPGDKRVRAQFESLERRASRSGKETVDHLPGSHDDVANSCAGALCLASVATVAPREPRIWTLPIGGGRYGNRIGNQQRD